MLVPTEQVHRINQQQEARQRAVDAYRRNILLPDVALADRRVPYTPVIKGEDGLEITAERRAQIMAEAGVKPMFALDEAGIARPTGETYGDKFDHVTPERLGESAEKNRHEMMIVLPRELTDEDITSAQEEMTGRAMWIGELENRTKCGVYGGNCVYTTNVGAVSNHEELVTAVLTACRRMREAAEDDEIQLYALMGPETKQAIDGVLVKAGKKPSRRLCGMIIRESREADTGVRINVSGVDTPDAPYARVFLHADTYDFEPEAQETENG